MPVKNSKMNVLISINSKFVMPAIVMLTSLFENNKIPIDVYMLYSSLSKEDIKKVKICVKRYNNKLFPIMVSEDLFKSAPVSKCIPKESYYRLLCYKVLPDTLDRVLYLDADVIINKSLIKFYNQNLKNFYLIACEEKSISQKNKSIYKACNIPIDKKYFNAGIIVFNLSMFRKYIDLNKIFIYIEDNKSKIKWHDQDILNALFYNKVRFDDYKIYNLQPFFVRYDKKNIKNGYNKAAIIHFAGPEKPWDKNSNNIPFADLFWKYANKTPYKYRNLLLQIKDIFYKYLNLL